MILESSNTQSIKKEFKNLEKKIIIFIAVFLINLLTYNNQVVLIVTPFLVLGYLLGFSYLIIVIMASFIASVIHSPLAFYEVCLFVVIFLIAVLVLKLTKLRIHIRMLIGSYVGDILARYIYEVGIVNEMTITPLFISMFTLLLSYFVIKISESLLNEEVKQYPYLHILYMLTIFSLALFGLDYYIYDVSILFILVSVFYLFTMKILDVSIYGSFLFISFMLLLFLNKLDINYMMLLFIPPLLSNLSKKKYLNIIIYLISSLLLLSIFKIKMNYVILITYSSIIILYVFIPSSLYDYLKVQIANPLNNISLYEKKYQKQEKEIEDELEKLSTLFSLIIEEYGKDNKKRLERKKEDVLYHSLCVACHKNKVCYGKDKTLKNLLIKSIESELTEQEINYINKECLKPSKFFEISEIFKQDYFKEYKYYLEYNNLKEALKCQMKGISTLLDNYKEKLKLDNNININFENRIIKNLLDRHQIDVLFVDSYLDLKNNMNIHLCVKVSDHQIVYKIKDLISNEFNINLEIENVSDYSLDGFLKIEYKEKREFKFLHGIYQINLKEEGNGDSYLVYENNNYLIYCLSDGMGSGKDAKEESRFTLKVLKSILETGMDLKNGIILMNSLLKIKNRYEMYATLDLVSINKKSLKSHFYKNGAMHSYIYSFLEKRLVRINSSSLPIGIVDNISSSDYTYRLRENDILIMFSDGIKESEETLGNFFNQIKDYNPQIIAKEIGTRFKNNVDLDDVSVLVVKIEK